MAADALEAELMPMAVFVGEILVVWSYRLGAFLTVVCKQFLVAWDAMGVLFLEDISAGHQLLVTVPAR